MTLADCDTCRLRELVVIGVSILAVHVALSTVVTVVNWGPFPRPAVWSLVGVVGVFDVAVVVPWVWETMATLHRVRARDQQGI